MQTGRVRQQNMGRVKIAGYDSCNSRCKRLANLAARTTKEAPAGTLIGQSSCTCKAFLGSRQHTSKFHGLDELQRREAYEFVRWESSGRNPRPCREPHASRQQCPWSAQVVSSPSASRCHQGARSEKSQRPAHLCKPFLAIYGHSHSW